MVGTLVYVMGPSGSGKDSLIAHVRQGPCAIYAMTWNISSTAQSILGPILRPIFFARRYITRPMNAGGEQHYPVTQEEFQFRKKQGDFALAWESHGLCYGIGADIDTHLAAGAVVVVNGSRAYLPEALRRYPSLLPVLIAARPDVLRERLEKRGRENRANIDERLAGASLRPEVSALIQIDNSGSLAEAGRIFSDLFHRLRHQTAH